MRVIGYFQVRGGESFAVTLWHTCMSVFESERERDERREGEREKVLIYNFKRLILMNEPLILLLRADTHTEKLRQRAMDTRMIYLLQPKFRSSITPLIACLITHINYVIVYSN